jgi:hypothetical protein
MDTLSKFGQFLVENLRDKAIEQNEMMLEGRLKASRLQALQSQIQGFTDDQRRVLRDVVLDVVDTAIHDLLFAIQDAHDRGLGIEISVDGQNVAEISGMLQGESVGEEGWIRKFSRYAK